MLPMMDEGFERAWRIFLRKSGFTTNWMHKFVVLKIEIGLIKLVQFMFSLIPKFALSDKQ